LNKQAIAKREKADGARWVFVWPHDHADDKFFESRVPAYRYAHGRAGRVMEINEYIAMRERER
jgi:hypothetical protein